MKNSQTETGLKKSQTLSATMKPVRPSPLSLDRCKINDHGTQQKPHDETFLSFFAPEHVPKWKAREQNIKISSCAVVDPEKRLIRAFPFLTKTCFSRISNVFPGGFVDRGGVSSPRKLRALYANCCVCGGEEGKRLYTVGHYQRPHFDSPPGAQNNKRTIDVYIKEWRPKFPFPFPRCDFCAVVRFSCPGVRNNEGSGE